MYKWKSPVKNYVNNFLEEKRWPKSLDVLTTKSMLKQMLKTVAIGGR